VKVLVTGAGGMVGRAVVKYCSSIGDEVVAQDHGTLDISDPHLVMQAIQDDKPEAVFNCAAWTDVDGCELDHERAYAVNAAGPENLAKASNVVGATFVTISTDYVFDGKKTGFYTQQDEPHPVSVYGVSKLEGEQRAQRAYPGSTVVVRTGFVFGVGGTNFLSTIVARARRGEKLKAISDSYGTPTYAWDLAVRLRELAQLPHTGIFHVTNAGDGVSYEEFARAALVAGGINPASLERVVTDSLHRPAPRPKNSRLRCLRSGETGLPPLPFWKDSLGDFVTLAAPSGAPAGVSAKD